MPKETISTASAQRRVEAGDTQPVVTVTWSREQYVQVATVLPATTTGSAEAAVDQGWFVDMDRQALNRLIRALRRARDQAYGRDE